MDKRPIKVISVLRTFCESLEKIVCLLNSKLGHVTISLSLSLYQRHSDIHTRTRVLMNSSVTFRTFVSISYQILLAKEEKQVPM